MAIQQLTQPIVNPIAAFDATKAQEITFIVIGGAQVVANRLVISNNETGEVVYDNQVATMSLTHVIPAGVLTNGGYYNAVIYTLDSSNNLSVPSTASPFYCYSQPTLSLVNIPASGTIENGTYTFQGNYSQQENEILNSYQFILYDSNKNILSKSDVIYYQSDNTLAYTFVGMNNDTSYYIELKGKTVNNTEITSGVSFFTVRYSQPVSFSIVDLVNDCENGFIQISSNIVAIDGKSNPQPPIYIDNQEVDLRDKDSWVEWNEGFDIKNDFTMRVWGRDFNDYENIITLSNNQDATENPNRIEMKWMLGDVVKNIPNYQYENGENVYISNGIKTKIKDLSIYGRCDQVKTQEKELGVGNSVTLEDTQANQEINIDIYGDHYQVVQDEKKTEANGDIIVLTDVDSSKPAKITKIGGQYYQKITTGSKNVLPLKTLYWESGGVSFYVAEDGSMRLSGTATGDIFTYIAGSHENLVPFVSLKNGEKFTFSYGDVGYDIEFKFGNLSNIFYVMEKNTPSKTFTIRDDWKISFVTINISKGTTLDVTLHPMLEIGGEKTSWVSPDKTPMIFSPVDVQTVQEQIKINVFQGEVESGQVYNVPIQEDMLDGDYINQTEEKHFWKKLVLTGKDNMVFENSSINKVYVLKNAIPNPKNIENIGISNCYIYNNVQSNIENSLEYGEFAFDLSNGNIFVKETNFYDVRSFNLELSGRNANNKPIIIYYKEKEGTVLGLTGEQKIAMQPLNNLSLYEGENTISTKNSSSYPAIIYADYNIVYSQPSLDHASYISSVGGNINYFKVEPQTSYDVTITVREDGGIVLNGTATQTVRITNVVDLGTGDFTLSVKSNKVDGGVYVRTRNKAGTLGLSTSLTSTSIITSNNTEAYSTELTINKDTVLEDFILYPKLERGLVATPYSPFGMGSVRIDVVNSNLLGFNAIQEGNVKVNEDGTITINGKGGFSLIVRKFIAKANTKYYLRWELISGTVSGINIFMNPILKKGWFKKDTFVESSVTKDSEISNIWINEGAVFSNAKIKIWISKSQNDFTKYQSQTAIMPIQQEMLEGDYIKDVEHHEWGKLILTGNDFDYAMQQNEKGLNYFYFGQPLTKMRGRIISNMLKYNADLWTTTQYMDYVNISGSQHIINIMLSDTTITTVAQFKTKLQELYNAGTPLILYYELAEPLELELTDQQKTARAQKLYTYKNVTNILASESLPILKVKTQKTPYIDSPSKIQSVGNIRNLLGDELNQIIEYNSSYYKVTDTEFELKANYIYNLSFVYYVESSTTDIYYTVCYKSENEIFDITKAIQYTNQITGENRITFIVPSNIPLGSTLSIKFARTTILADVRVDINKVQLIRGRKYIEYRKNNNKEYYINPIATKKNLFDIETIYYIENENVSFDFLDNGFDIELVDTEQPSYLSFVVPNVLQPNETYYVSYQSYGNIIGLNLYLFDKDKGSRIEKINMDNGRFIAPQSCYDLEFEYIIDDKVENNKVQILNIQIENDNISDYESYIKNTTGIIYSKHQLKGIDKYKDVLCLQTLNILDPDTKVAIVEGNVQYYFSQNGSTSYEVEYINEDGNVIRTANLVNETFVTPKNCVKVKVNSDDIVANQVQISKENVPYYPYLAQPSSVYYIKSLELNGSENIELTEVSGGISKFELNGIEDMKHIDSNVVLSAISNYFIGVPYQSIETNYMDGLVSAGNKNITFTTNRFATAQDFKDWIKEKKDAGTPVIVNYIMNTPTVEAIQDETILSSLQGLETFNGVSHVFMGDSLLGNVGFSYIDTEKEEKIKNYYVSLKCWNSNAMPYFIHSNYIDTPLETDKIFIWLRRKNNIFDLKIENLGDYKEDDPTKKGKPQVAIIVNETTKNSINITANVVDTVSLVSMKFSKDNGETWEWQSAIDGLSASRDYTFEGLAADTSYPITVECVNTNDIKGSITQIIKTNN